MTPGILLTGLLFMQQDVELRMGQRMLEEQRQRSPTEADPRFDAFAQKVADRLKLAAAEVTVVDTMHYTEPVSLPGEILLVPLSWFRKAANVDQFAVMLAHGRAHGVLRHGWSKNGTTRVWRQHQTHTSVPPFRKELEEAMEAEADVWAAERLKEESLSDLEPEFALFHTEVQPAPKKRPTLYRKQR
jgi:hypothetical protein